MGKRERERERGGREKERERERERIFVESLCFLCSRQFALHLVCIFLCNAHKTLSNKYIYYFYMIEEEAKI